MRFMLLLKGDELSETGALPDERIIAAMGKFHEDLTNAGVLLAAEGLHPTSKGVRLRQSGGKRSVTDGPFAETKELLAGFWVIDVPSKEEAIAWAARCPFEAAEAAMPGDSVGRIEIRQVFETEDFPVEENESGWREQEEARRAASQVAPPSDVAPQSAGVPATTSMRFMMMFMADQDSEAGILPTEKLLTEMGGIMTEMATSGVLLAGDGLQPSSKGARLAYSKGKRVVTDGPFTETKELLAGYSIIRVQSKEEAVAWGLRCLEIDAAGRGGESAIDIRQVFEASEFPAELLEGARELRS